MADVSNAYWGQVEKGYVSVGGEYRPVTPTRRTLLAICDALRMTPKETQAVLAAAGHKGYVPGDMKAPRESEVDLTGLSRKDVALLNAIADRFREGVEVADVVPLTVEPTPLRRVASGRPTRPAPERETAAERKAREAAKNNPHGRRSK
jgi:hypothetical protein